MFDIYPRPRIIRPTGGVYIYIDVIQAWFREPLSRSQLRDVQALCNGHLFHENVAAGFDPSYRQRIQLHQPTDEAIDLLADRNDAHLNYFELAVDGIHAGPDGDRNAMRAVNFINKHLVQRRHRGGVRTICGAVRNTGRRWRNAKVFSSYADLPSKVTGELGCCHVELQMSFASTLKRNGIGSFADVRQLDLWALFSKEFMLVDAERLGLAYDNYVRGSRLRSPIISRGRNCTYNHHHRLALFLMRGSGSMQELLDNKRLPPAVQRRMRDFCLDVSEVFPTPGTFL